MIKAFFIAAITICTATTTWAQRVITDSDLTKGVAANGHYYVDLGLNAYWATTNVGAKSPSDQGLVVAWAETTSKKTYTKENTYPTSKVKKLKVKGSAQYDAARKNWGGKWRLPTQYESSWLVKKCTWEMVTYNGTTGFLITSKRNGNTIFMPGAEGQRYWTCTWGGGSDGWEGMSYILLQKASLICSIDITNHWEGLPVRGVIEKPGYEKYDIYNKE